jgi:hypothetical protein
MMNKLASGNKIDQLPLISINESTDAELKSSNGRTVKAEIATKPAIAIPSVPSLAITEKVQEDILATIAKTLPNREGDRLPPVTDALIDKFMEWGNTYNGEMGTGTKVPGGFVNKLKSDPSVKKEVYDKIRQIYQQAYDQSLKDLHK